MSLHPRLLGAPVHVVLIGYRCAGKTTVGKILAEKLEMRFFDTDKLVEAKAKKPVIRIFQEDGEGEFRRYESEVIEEICGGDGKVISVGGGGVVRQKNVMHIQKCGRIFHLKVTPETVRARFEKDPAAAASRPSITRDDVIEEARDMMARREPFYREAAEFTIDANSKTPEEIAEEIVGLLKKHPEKKKKEDGPKRSRYSKEGKDSSNAGKKKKPLERSDPDSVGLFPRER